MRFVIMAAIGVALACPSFSSAGEVYRWTDANGVLHIADVPPPAGQAVQKQTMRDAPPRPAAAPAADGAPAAAEQATGPAEVVITEQESEGLGGSKHGVSGTVENKGMAAAHDVAIVVHVISPSQGDECLEEQIAVVSSLAPGEKAKFSADFDHPCFHGPTQVDLRAQWH